MPLQNRVTPFGEIVAEPWRGGLTGNRGCLHRADGTLGTARWRHKAWVSCLTEFRGRWRPPMPPLDARSKWTALFFWDEAVALTAGHRPCGQCRYKAHVAFREAWVRAGLVGQRAAEIDRVLHSSRVTPTRQQVTHEAPAAALPNGAFAIRARAPSVPLLAWRGRFLSLSQGHGGYADAGPMQGWVTVLTPRPILAVLAAGYTVAPAGVPTARRPLSGSRSP
ncbi:MAG: hypothetical protein AAF713_01540 [Pseudomonadota bacterium]